LCFDSLRPGRCIPRTFIGPYDTEQEAFRFPTTGKVHFKDSDEHENISKSIQFRFPTNGKAHFKKQTTSSLKTWLPEFRFPTTGKVHFKDSDEHENISKSIQFRFPTNGKAHFKKQTTSSLKTWLPEFRFPTTGKVLGKCKKEDDLDAVDNFPGFNSLRPGKCFAS
jgi:hypothetical protein